MKTHYTVDWIKPGDLFTAYNGNFIVFVKYDPLDLELDKRQYHFYSVKRNVRLELNKKEVLRLLTPVTK